MKSKQFFKPSSVTYTRAQVNSSAIANICWLIQTFKYQCCGFQVHLESFLVYNLNTKSDFWSKCPHCIMGYMITLGSMFVLFSLDLAYIDYSLCQIWSVYKQYLRCCDHFNKCLFLVIQQAEVLLNFFGKCIMEYTVQLCILFSGLILGLRRANERRRYFATTSLIGWAHAQNQPCVFYDQWV